MSVKSTTAPNCSRGQETNMLAKGLTPILNVSDIVQSFA
jgi:hypothetical protein